MINMIQHIRICTVRLQMKIIGVLLLVLLFNLQLSTILLESLGARCKDDPSKGFLELGVAMVTVSRIG